MNFKKLMASAMVCAFALTGCGSNTATTSEDKDTFVVGMECAYAPFNWQTSEKTDTSVKLGKSGYADGYDVQIAKKIAKKLGKKLVIKKTAWDGLIPALEGDEIDAIIAGMTKDKTREEGADFTTPYYDSKGMIMIVRKDGEEAGYTDIQQFTGKNVVGQKSTNYDDVIDQIKGVNHVTPKATYPEMVLALQQHEVDGITAEMAVAKGVVEANPDLTVVQFADGHGFDCQISSVAWCRNSSPDRRDDWKSRSNAGRISLTSVWSFKKHKKQGRHSERLTDQRQRELPVPMSDQPQLQPFQSRVRKKCRK